MPARRIVKERTKERNLREKVYTTTSISSQWSSCLECSEAGGWEGAQARVIQLWISMVKTFPLLIFRQKHAVGKKCMQESVNKASENRLQHVSTWSRGIALLMAKETKSLRNVPWQC